VSLESFRTFSISRTRQRSGGVAIQLRSPAQQIADRIELLTNGSAPAPATTGDDRAALAVAAE